MKASAKFNALRDAVLCHQFRYYVLSSPTISDYEYDQLEKQLYEMECQLKGVPQDEIRQGKPDCIISSDNASDYPEHIRKQMK